jgi:hypothetical protein
MQWFEKLYNRTDFEELVQAYFASGQMHAGEIELAILQEYLDQYNYMPFSTEPQQISWLLGI